MPRRCASAKLNTQKLTAVTHTRQPRSPADDLPGAADRRTTHHSFPDGGRDVQRAAEGGCAESDGTIGFSVETFLSQVGFYKLRG